MMLLQILERNNNSTKHYALNNQILAAFDSLYDNKIYKLAYAIGMQFVEVALLEIPKHGYFYSARHRQERHDNSKNAVRVTQLLQRLLTEEESDLQKQVTENDLLRVQKLHHLAKEQAHTDATRYEHDRIAIEQDLQASTSSLGAFCGQIMDYHEIMAGICPPPGPETPEVTTTTTKTTTADTKKPVTKVPSSRSLTRRASKSPDQQTLKAPPRRSSRRSIPPPASNSLVRADDDQRRDHRSEEATRH